MNRRSGHNLRGKPDLKGNERKKRCKRDPSEQREYERRKKQLQGEKIGKGLPRREVQRLKLTRRQCQKKRKENMKEIKKGNRE